MSEELRSQVEDKLPCIKVLVDNSPPYGYHKIVIQYQREEDRFVLAYIFQEMTLLLPEIAKLIAEEKGLSYAGIEVKK